MTTFQLTAHVIPEPGATEPSTTLYRMVERQWPTVPRKGDTVSLGGGDLLLEEVQEVQFLDGKIVLRFLVQAEDRLDLIDLNFKPAG